MHILLQISFTMFAKTYLAYNRVSFVIPDANLYQARSVKAAFYSVSNKRPPFNGGLFYLIDLWKFTIISVLDIFKHAFTLVIPGKMFRSLIII